MNPTHRCALPTDGACCCTCKYLVADHSHPETDGGSINEQRGWICLAPEFGFVFSAWPAHGLCEGWTGAEEVA